MSIGARIGARIGAAIGASIAGDPLGGGPAWTVDAASQKGTPVNATEWAAVMAAAGIASGGPSLLYLMQEAAGNIIDAIGGLVGTASGTGLSYRNAVAGWTRKAINTTDGGTGTFTNSNAALPDLSTTSMMQICYLLNTTNGATRSLFNAGTTVVEAECTVTPITRQVCGANNATGSNNPLGSVRPWVQRFNRTATTCIFATDQEKFTTPFGATATGKQVKVGAAGGASCGGSYLYFAMFFGAAAEISDAQLKTLLQKLGWTIPWS